MKFSKIGIISIALCCTLSVAQFSDDHENTEDDKVEEDDLEEMPRTNIPIGIILYHDEFYLERAFDRAVKNVNAEEGRTFELLAVIKRLNPHSSSETLQSEACDLIDNGVVAIFGPSSKTESDIVALICNSTGIPHLQFDIVREESAEENFNHQMTLNLYPHQLVMSKAYADIVQLYGWRKFTIIYDEEDTTAPLRLQDLLQLRDVHSESVRVRKYRRDMDYFVFWKSVMGERRIVLDCVPELLVELVQTSQEYGLTDKFNHLFLTNLETTSANMTPLLDNETYAMNVTAVRLQMQGEHYNLDEEEMAKLYYADNIEDASVPYKMLLPDLLTDAVTLLADALQNATTTLGSMPMPSVRCEYMSYDTSRTWTMGDYILGMMKATSGVDSERFRTTDLQFDPDGQRVGLSIEIFKPIENYGFAVWNTKGVIQPLHVKKTIVDKVIYRVATRIDEPYFMIIPEMVQNNVTGNERYKGFAVDLIQALSEEVGFAYEFVPVADNNYGKYNPETKLWNGIIGEILYNDAHMGICDLTITQARKKAVDFTVPFMQLGISILAYKTPYEPNNVFAFLAPFKTEVWIYVLLAIFVITFTMMFVARLAKTDWENPHICNKEPETLENMWNTSNMLWLALASITTAGCDILPKSSPTRTINATWWIFAIIIANSYLANLAAFLTSNNMASSIQGIEDLAQQTQVKFGTIAGGSTYNYFADSNETTYRLAFNIMNGNDQSSYTKGNKEGVSRVLKEEGKYMFLMETTSLEYQLYRNCSLTRVGEKFGEKHYAIAVPLGATYRSDLSVGILRLSELGKLNKMKQEWWEAEEPCPVDDEKQSDTPELTFDEVRGIFYTLAGGIALGYVVGIVEFILHCHHIAAEERLTFKEACTKELLFVLKIWNNKKPISCTPTASRGSSSEKTSRKKSSSSSTDTHGIPSMKSAIKRANSNDNDSNADKHTLDERV